MSHYWVLMRSRIKYALILTLRATITRSLLMLIKNLFIFVIALGIVRLVGGRSQMEEEFEWGISIVTAIGVIFIAQFLFFLVAPSTSIGRKIIKSLEKQEKASREARNRQNYVTRLIRRIPQTLRNIDKEMELSVKSCAFKPDKESLESLGQIILDNMDKQKASPDYQRNCALSSSYANDITRSETAFVLDGSEIGLRNLIDSNPKLKRIWDTLQAELDAIQTRELKTNVELYKMILYCWHSSVLLRRYRYTDGDTDRAQYEGAKSEVDWRLSKIMPDINRGIKRELEQ